MLTVTMIDTLTILEERIFIVVLGVASNLLLFYIIRHLRSKTKRTAYNFNDNIDD